MESKNITIQLWTDLYYTRVIGIWYPEAPEPIELTSPEMEQPHFNDSPFLIVLSSMYEPRNEVMGGNPVAPGQHPMPKDFLEKQIRHMSYLFANEFGIFQPESKAMAKTFLAKQTVSYKMIKEQDVVVRPATGSMSLRDLRNSIDQYTEEEQEEIQVLTVGEHPNDADAKHIDKFIHADKIDTQRQYISVTKLTEVYSTDDPYIKKTSLPEDPATMSLAPGTEEAEFSQIELAKTEEAIAEDNTNRETLETFDTMSEPSPVMTEDDEPLLDDNGEPVMEAIEPSRVEVLEQLLKDKDKQLIDAGLMEPTLPVPDEPMPEPTLESDLYPPLDTETEAPIDESNPYEGEM